MSSGRWLVVCETAAVPRRTVLLVSTLAREAEVDVFCWSRRGTAQVPVELDGRVILSRGTSLPAFLAELTRRLGRGYDGVMVADLRLLGWVEMIAPGTRVVYDRMEIPSVTLASKIRRLSALPERFALRWAERIERGVAARVSGVLSVPLSGAAAEHLRRLHSRVLPVSNWPLRSELDAYQAAPRARNEPFTLIHSGAISPSTGLETLLDAIELLGSRAQAAHLVLVGYFVGADRTEIDGQVGARGLGHLVTVMDRVPYTSLRPLLAGAHAGVALLDPRDPKFRFVAPGMSRKIFEYMASGLPVLTNPPQGTWVEGEGCGLTVPFHAPDELASAVERLAGDEELRMRLGEAGRRAVEERYHWERQEVAIRRFVLGGGEA